MSKKIIQQTPLSLPEVKEILEQRRERLDAMQLRVLEYARKYSKLSPSKAKQLIEELMLNFELTREEAVQIVDICPTNIEELRSILSGYKRLVSFILFSEDKLQAIVNLIEKYLREDIQE